MSADSKTLKAEEILLKYWGHSGFRPLQAEIIESVNQGKDVLALLPTGGGKSVCFQVPALMKEGICLVVSPLIALMKDQVKHLNEKGISALSIFSGMSFNEVRKTLQNAAHGNYKFLYVSPERLATKLFKEYLPALNINLIAVDEAHCISQWGFDFRPPYMKIAEIREHLPNVPILALTASATKEVQDDICKNLRFGKDSVRYQQSFDRPALSYSIFKIPTRQNKLIEILEKVKGSAIVYCRTRRQTKDIAQLLQQHQIIAEYYHAGLSMEERNKQQLAWIENKTRVMVCTNAFGMGIDKPDVRVVVHYGTPDCLENYYQEAGRAGRDGKRAYAVLLCNNKELTELKEQASIRYPDETTIRKIYFALMNYLQVAAGVGEGLSFDFDLNKFTDAYQLSPVTTLYVLKTLEQEGLLQFNEVFYKPSTIVFIAGKQEISDFESTHPQLEELIKTLLRTYEGIFDFPVSISETLISKNLRAPIQTIRPGLKALHQAGIIQYSMQKENPQIYLLFNRMYSDAFRINLKNYHLRKQKFEERVAAMLKYINDEDSCRAQMIAGYFNDSTCKKCNICDNCIRIYDKSIAASDFNSLSEYILNISKGKEWAVQELLKNVNDVEKEKIWQVINFLLAEKKISINQEGYIIS